jgi:hypothetical protein
LILKFEITTGGDYFSYTIPLIKKLEAKEIMESSNASNLVLLYSICFNHKNSRIIFEDVLLNRFIFITLDEMKASQLTKAPSHIKEWG